MSSGLERQRVKSALLGTFVGDAASMPVHWIYDNSKLKETLGDKLGDPLFFAQPELGS